MANEKNHVTKHGLNSFACEWCACKATTAKKKLGKLGNSWVKKMRTEKNGNGKKGCKVEKTCRHDLWVQISDLAFAFSSTINVFAAWIMFEWSSINFRVFWHAARIERHSRSACTRNFNCTHHLMSNGYTFILIFSSWLLLFLPLALRRKHQRILCTKHMKTNNIPWNVVHVSWGERQQLHYGCCEWGPRECE